MPPQAALGTGVHILLFTQHPPKGHPSAMEPPCGAGSWTWASLQSRTWITAVWQAAARLASWASHFSAVWQCYPLAAWACSPPVPLNLHCRLSATGLTCWWMQSRAGPLPAGCQRLALRVLGLTAARMPSTATAWCLMLPQVLQVLAEGRCVPTGQAHTACFC